MAEFSDNDIEPVFHPDQTPLPGLEEWEPERPDDEPTQAERAAQAAKAAGISPEAPSLSAPTSRRIVVSKAKAKVKPKSRSALRKDGIRAPVPVAAKAAERSRERANEKESARGFRILEIFLVGLTVTVGILILGVAILLLRPNGTQNIFAGLDENLRATLGPSYDTAAGAIGGVTKRAERGYELRIRPIVARVGGAFGIEIKDTRVGVSGRTIVDADVELALKCRACHDKYAYRTALEGVYIDHGVHGLPWQHKQEAEAAAEKDVAKEGAPGAAQAAEGAEGAKAPASSGGGHGAEGEEGGLVCKACHAEVPEDEPLDVAHFKEEINCLFCHVNAQDHLDNPRDLNSVRVPESTCYECHTNKDQSKAKVKDARTCRYCHAPGWNFSDGSDEFVAQKKTERFLSHSQVHKKKLDNPIFSSPSLTGDKRSYCSNCHRRSSFCNDCHQVTQGSHKDRARFVATHGQKIIKTREWHMTECWVCHDGGWCAKKCHPLGPQRRGVPNRAGPVYPIPWKSLGIE